MDKLCTVNCWLLGIDCRHQQTRLILLHQRRKRTQVIHCWQGPALVSSPIDMGINTSTYMDEQYHHPFWSSWLDELVAALVPDSRLPYWLGPCCELIWALLISNANGWHCLVVG